MYPNASFTHFREILREDYGINVSTSSLANILQYEALIVSPLANKSTVIKYRGFCKSKIFERLIQF